MASGTGGLWNSTAQGCWAPRLRSTQGWDARQRVAPGGLGCGRPHLLGVGGHIGSHSVAALAEHVRNSGLGTHARLCQPRLIPGELFLPKPAHGKAQQTARTEKDSTSPSCGLWCKEKGRRFQCHPQPHRCTYGKGWPLSPCVFHEMWPLQSEVQTPFKDKAISTCEQHLLVVTGTTCLSRVLEMNTVSAQAAVLAPIEH